MSINSPFVLWVALAILLIVLILLGVLIRIFYFDYAERKEEMNIGHKADASASFGLGGWETALANLDKVTTAFSDEEKKFKVLQLDEDEVRYYISRMKRWVVGQDDVLVRLAHIMYRKRQLSRAGSPIATLLFIGPRGVGKTATSKAMGDAFFGSPRFTYVLDMMDPFYVDLSLKDSVERVVSTRSRGVLVFEGIERKPRELLEVLDPYYRGSDKRLNGWMVVLATSALHDHYVKKIEPQGSSMSREAAVRKMKETLFSRGLMMDEMDFYIDKTLLFSSLDEKAFWVLGVKHLKEVSKSYSIPLLGVTPDALSHLVKVSKNGSSGARTILGYIHSVILDRLLLLSNQKVWLDAEDGRFVLKSGYGKEVKAALNSAEEKNPSRE